MIVTTAQLYKVAYKRFAVGAYNINNIEQTSTCRTCGEPGMPACPQADLDRWGADGIVSAGANFSFPNTRVDFWYCANRANETPGQGSFLYDAIEGEKSLACATGPCQGEPVWEDPAAFAAMVDDMDQRCVPRH